MSEDRPMMRTIREFLEADPFVPFTIVLTSGDRFVIENPGLLTIEKDHFAYYTPRSDGRAYVRLNQIVFLQTS